MEEQQQGNSGEGRTYRPVALLKKELQKKEIERNRVLSKIEKIKDTDIDAIHRQRTILRAIEKEMFELRDEMYGEWAPESWKRERKK